MCTFTGSHKESHLPMKYFWYLKHGVTQKVTLLLDFQFQTNTSFEPQIQFLKIEHFQSVGQSREISHFSTNHNTPIRYSVSDMIHLEAKVDQILCLPQYCFL
jgi:hypothetical protein